MSRDQRIRDLIAKWQPRLGLQAWDVRYNPARKVGKGRDAEAALKRYLLLCEIGIRKNCPDSELEAHVLHELIHVVIDPLAFKAQTMAGALCEDHTVLLDETGDVIEAVIERLVNAMLNRRQMPYGKKAAKHFSTFMDAA